MLFNIVSGASFLNVFYDFIQRDKLVRSDNARIVQRDRSYTNFGSELVSNEIL